MQDSKHTTKSSIASPNDVGGGDVSRTITINNNGMDTRNIFIGTREVTITHGNDRYRLRLTAQNKLILTK